MTDTDRWAALREAAAKATPGPWTGTCSDHGDKISIVGPDDAIVIDGCGCCGSPYSDNGVENTRYFCAAHPSAIVELLTERDRLAAELAEARKDAAHFAGRVAGIELERDQYRSQWQQQCEIARLAGEKLAAWKRRFPGYRYRP